MSWLNELSSQLPEAVTTGAATASSVEDVQITCRIASAHGIPVITRGAASGLAGAAAAGEGTIVLDVSGLNRILELDAQEAVAVVEPGVITAEFDAAAREHGLFFAPDPGSVGISTVGGNIATNAGGLRGAKYGVTREAVLGMSVVLADGRLIHTGKSTIKGVTGYDLTALFTGSEGTLGVIVSATLRLLPAPGGTATAAAYFADLDAAAEAASAVVASGARPATLELVDGSTLGAIDQLTGSDLRARGAAFLLIQTDGYGADQELKQAVAAIEATATRIDTATDPQEAQRLMAARRQALPAVQARGRALIEDIAVPRKYLAAAIREIGQIVDAHGVEAYVFAHAGDGNIHPILVYHGPENAIPDNVNAADDEIFALALRYGGTITAEHGVGLLKQKWVAKELGADVVGLSQQIKAVFDPAGVLNPGKAI